MTFIRGALLEYKPGTKWGLTLGAFLFQFNPESLSRTISIPSRPTTPKNSEQGQVGDPPQESISMTAYFDASDQLGEGDPIANRFGIGPKLVSLERLANPLEKRLFGEAMGAAFDKIGAFLGPDKKESKTPIPRESYPSLLFIWGTNRVLPVTIDSLTITEKKFDHLLNPVQAEVAMTLSVVEADPCVTDKITRGALQYTNIMRDQMVVGALFNTVTKIVF